MMIMSADTRALSPSSDSADNGSWEANLDPTDTTSSTCGQLPSNRHNYKTDIAFCDGHTESPLRSLVISPTQNNVWRQRWNNDNQVHNEINWSPLSPVNPASALDPSY